MNDKLPNFEFDEAVSLGDSSFEINADDAISYQKNLGISVVSSDEQKAEAESLADVFLN